MMCKFGSAPLFNRRLAFKKQTNKQTKQPQLLGDWNKSLTKALPSEAIKKRKATRVEKKEKKNKEMKDDKCCYQIVPR